MTGYNIYKKICALLGYSVGSDSHSDRRTERMTSIINQIAQDLKIDAISSLSEKIETTPQKKEALIYGCAMMLAVTESDSSHANLFGELYNAKRGAALSCTDTRQDTLPAPSEGGI